MARVYQVTVHHVFYVFFFPFCDSKERQGMSLIFFPAGPLQIMLKSSQHGGSKQQGSALIKAGPGSCDGGANDWMSVWLDWTGSGVVIDGRS